MKLIKFEKDSCTPCKMVEGFLNSNDIKVDSYFNVLSDTDQEQVDKFGIQSVPTLILLDNNNVEIQRSIGFNPPELEDIISKM